MPPAYTTQSQTSSTERAMDFRFYKRARGIKHKAAATPPLYPSKPAPAAPAHQQPAGSNAKQPTAAKVRSVPAATPPSAAVTVEVDGGGSDDDVDRRAALYISRVLERLRRERLAEDWRKYY